MPNVRIYVTTTQEEHILQMCTTFFSFYPEISESSGRCVAPQRMNTRFAPTDKSVCCLFCATLFYIANKYSISIPPSDKSYFITSPQLCVFTEWKKTQLYLTDFEDVLHDDNFDVNCLSARCDWSALCQLSASGLHVPSATWCFYRLPHSGRIKAGYVIKI